MTMGDEFKKRNEQRTARRIQKQTGMKYTTVLRMVREDIQAGGLVHTPKGLLTPNEAADIFPEEDF